MRAPLSDGSVDVFRSNFDGCWYWHIQAFNGEVIAASEGYERKDGALHGVQSLARVLGGPVVEWINEE